MVEDLIRSFHRLVGGTTEPLDDMRDAAALDQIPPDVDVQANKFQARYAVVAAFSTLGRSFSEPWFETVTEKSLTDALGVFTREIATNRINDHFEAVQARDHSGMLFRSLKNRRVDAASARFNDPYAVPGQQVLDAVLGKAHEHPKRFLLSVHEGKPYAHIYRNTTVMASAVNIGVPSREVDDEVVTNQAVLLLALHPVVSLTGEQEKAVWTFNECAARAAIAALGIAQLQAIAQALTDTVKYSRVVLTGEMRIHALDTFESELRRRMDALGNKGMFHPLCTNIKDFDVYLRFIAPHIERISGGNGD